ncbi:MAG: tRNA 4-thiouridine(8) synthase ThiI [Acholeplasmatales bacterium]|jgi:thiamine biosynthesis protein ThiI|nr:tRNA 4-thiouridine(8) synthase ThiI [Acholeplasmatales bacterium]
MKHIILVRFGELVLKGKNIKFFINLLYDNIYNKLRNTSATIERHHDRFFIHYDEKDSDFVVNALQEIPGIHSYSKVYQTSLDINICASDTVKVLQEKIDKPTTFKIESKRSNKEFYLTSLEFSRTIAPIILSNLNSKLHVDVHNPLLTLTYEIRNDFIYYYFDSFQGLGGFPSKSSGKGLVMLSGGIDSPVCSFLSLKQGMDIELFHFESSPLTPLESIDKVIDLAKVISKYTFNEKIKLNIVPISNLHSAILENVKDSYIITILRRMMYRIASVYCIKNDILCIINGESLGQVASQTLQSMNTISSVSNTLILRPLLTYDKQDIMKISRNIKTYDISIRPFNDCCSIYVPTHPATKPDIKNSLEEESKFDYNTLIADVLRNIKHITITPSTSFKISEYGLTFLEAFEELRKQGLL